MFDNTFFPGLFDLFSGFNFSSGDTSFGFTGNSSASIMPLALLGGIVFIVFLSIRR